MRLNIDLSNGKKNRNLFFTSDFHMFHYNVIGFDARPFMNVATMHTALVENWNSVVGDNDIVIYLGDLSFARKKDACEVINYVSELKGTIHYILGNHDKEKDILNMGLFESVSDYIELNLTHNIVNKEGNEELDKTFFCCMHYPIYQWNKKHHGSYMIHGHSHHGLASHDFINNNRIIDVGCNGWNYTPVSYQELIELKQGIDYKISNTHHK